MSKRRITMSLGPGVLERERRLDRLRQAVVDAAMKRWKNQIWSDEPGSMDAEDAACQLLDAAEREGNQ